MNLFAAFFEIAAYNFAYNPFSISTTSIATIIAEIRLLVILKSKNLFCNFTCLKHEELQEFSAEK